MNEITHIDQLKPDTRNARKHNPRNIGLIEDALNEVGAARSIVIDEDGRILAGNGTIEAAASAGIKRVQVVEADGETIIAVRRAGLSEAQKTRLALYDNQTAATAEWDSDVLAGMAADGVKLDDLFVQDELDAILGAMGATWDEALGSLPDGEKAPFQQMTFTLSDAQAETVKTAIGAAKQHVDFTDTGNENSNGNALALIAEQWMASNG